MDNIRENISKQLSVGHINKKEELMKEAASFIFGENWKIEEVKDRCSLLFMPNKEEIFCIDGEEMIVFFPFTFETTTEEYKTIVNIELKYKELYK